MIKAVLKSRRAKTDEGDTASNISCLGLISFRWNGLERLQLVEGLAPPEVPPRDDSLKASHTQSM